MRSSERLSRARGRKAWHYVRCVRDASVSLRLRRELIHLRKWRRAHAADFRAKRLWAYYRAHPMPWCTWGPESGGDYTARNPTSTAGGKYQMLDSTFHSVGGPDYPNLTHDAAYAPPLVQETMARRVLAAQGLQAWVNC